MQEFMNQTVLAGNELWRLFALFGVIIAGVVVAKIGKATLLRSTLVLERHGRTLTATAFRSLAKSMVFASVAIAFPAGAAFLNLGELASSLVKAVQGVLLNVALGLTLFHLIDVISVWLGGHDAGKNNPMDKMVAPIVRTSLQITIIALTSLQIVQSLTDKPLTSIIAGLGVGGLAVALAAQDTIKHFFGSLVLFADKPFQVGDRITVDAVDGTVELVGFRSSRIRTLEGALVSIPNGDLANKTIINIARRPYIRHRAVFSVTYDTSPDKMKRAIAIIQELLDNHEGMRPEFPPRVVFDEFASSSLNILVMFWFHPADFWAYKNFVEKFNLMVLERFTAEGISFAFPSQTIYMAKSSAVTAEVKESVS